MSSVSGDQVLSALEWRYAVKKFDPSRKIAESDWRVLEESLRLAPSSYGLQPWKFIVVRDPALREELKAHSWRQSQVTDCSHYVVLAIRSKLDEADIDRHMGKIASVRGVALESLAGYRKNAVGDLVTGARSAEIKAWAERQVYIAMGFLLHSAAMMGFDGCPMEGFDPAAYDRLLGLDGTGYATVATIACGYRDPGDRFGHVAKVRFDRDEVFEDR